MKLKGTSPLYRGEVPQTYKDTLFIETGDSIDKNPCILRTSVLKETHSYQLFSL